MHSGNNQDTRFVYTAEYGTVLYSMVIFKKKKIKRSVKITVAVVGGGGGHSSCGCREIMYKKLEI
jgi:hypothetical protein